MVSTSALAAEREECTVGYSGWCGVPKVEVQANTPNAGFVRVHKSFLVNLRHIKEYIRGEGSVIILSNNIEVEVSRRKKDLFFSLN